VIAVPAIAMAVLFGAWLRFNGLDWDHGFLMHPDEWNLVDASSRWRWGADPKYYNCNGLALILPRALTGIQSLFGAIANPDALESLSHASRIISATGSVILIIVLACMAWLSPGPWSAVLVAWLAACDVGLIQAAHFGTTDSSLVLVIAILALIAVAHIREYVAFWPFLYASSLFLALGCGFKTTCAAAAMIPLLGLFLSPKKPNIRQIVYAVPISLLIFVSAFFLVSPHSVLYVNEFLRIMRFEHDVVSGHIDVFWTRQFAGTPRFFFQIAQLPWLSGPLVPPLGLIGIGIICLFAMRKRGTVLALLPIALFSVAYFLYIGQWHAKFVRHLLPLTPGLLVGASVAAASIWEQAPRARRWISVCIAITVLTSISWAVTFSRIYNNEDSRITASRYILQHVQAGETILIEPRDVALPLRVVAGPEYTVEVLPLIEENRPGLLSEYVVRISSASWIVITSQRNFGTLLRLPQRFPLVCPYYRAILDGSLGFQLMQRFANYPTLFGITFDTRIAEETFTVFDHPEVLLFHRIKTVSASKIETELTSYAYAHASCQVNDF
jgi:hypothetical protein